MNGQPNIGTLMFFVVLAVGIVFLMVRGALGHEAPTGWTYPIACCSGIDCREVSSVAVEERPEGYVIAATGEVIGYADQRLKDSPDGAFHWCSIGGKPDTATICLFVPPRAY